MTMEEKLTELARAREGFRAFRDQVDADLARQRQIRLEGEIGRITTLILESAAAGATTGQIKRAYGTKDHRTIATILQSHASEIQALKSQRVARVESQPEWLVILPDGGLMVDLNERGVATFEVIAPAAAQEGSLLLFSTEEPLWDDTFSVKNEAVEMLDGKFENETDETALAARFWKEAQGGTRA